MTANNLYSQGYALIVGVNQQKSPALRSLPDVEKDINALHNVLVDPERCGYPPEQVNVLLGENATKNEILDGLDWLGAQIAENNDATAVVYYSGHGWHNSEDGKVQPLATHSWQIEGMELD